MIDQITMIFTALDQRETGLDSGPAHVVFLTGS